MRVLIAVEVRVKHMFQARSIPRRIIVVALLFLTIAIIPGIFSHRVSAAPIVDFKPGRIIEDSVFTNSVSMNPSQIQSFLDSKVTSCDTLGSQTSEYGGGTRRQWAEAHGHSAPFTCLKDYSENGLSAAQIIYNISQQYQINPQVFIVLLQKEQGLVTDTWPIATQYKTATGYGCPDTAACDSQYFGLTNQLTWSAKMFRAILNNNPNWYTPYSLGNNFVRWSPTNSCGGSTVYIENRSTQALYSYTPYQPNQAALNAGYGMGDGCSAYGNRNFYLYFRDWFGYNSGPAAFKVSSSSTIYIPVEGYKVSVPYMAAMQDYGISADSIQVVNQAYIDARPSPPASSGISSSISHVIKSPDDNDEDGGSVYLISRGKRYQFQSMAQLASFGFQESDISFLPLGYIFSMQNGGILSNFISSPYGSVFKINNSKKQMIFEYSTYIAQNPSDNIAALSYYLVDKIPSGNPISDRAIMIQSSVNNTVTLYYNSTYYQVPNYDTFACWGFDSSKQNTPTIRLPQDNYIPIFTPNSSLSCVINDGQSNQILNNTIRYTIPNTVAINGIPVTNDLKALAQKLPLRVAPLSSYIKNQDAAGVWYVNGTQRRIIPSYTAFKMLGLTDANVDQVNNSVLTTFSNNGLKLAEGQLVNIPGSSAVYVISGNQRILYDSSNVFESYRNNWNNIESYAQSALDQYYPFQAARVSNVLADKANQKIYIINQDRCYDLSSDILNTMGKSVVSISNAQTYDSNVFRDITVSACLPATRFIKEPGQSLVYWLDNGQKHPLMTYAAMLNKNNGMPPTVMTVDNIFLNSISVGSAYSL